MFWRARRPRHRDERRAQAALRWANLGGSCHCRWPGLLYGPCGACACRPRRLRRRNSALHTPRFPRVLGLVGLKKKGKKQATRSSAARVIARGSKARSAGPVCWASLICAAKPYFAHKPAGKHPHLRKTADSNTAMCLCAAVMMFFLFRNLHYSSETRTRRPGGRVAQRAFRPAISVSYVGSANVARTRGNSVTAANSGARRSASRRSPT